MVPDSNFSSVTNRFAKSQFKWTPAMNMTLPNIMLSLLWFAATVLGTYHLVPLWDELAMQRIKRSLPGASAVGANLEVVRYGLRIWGVAMLVIALVFIAKRSVLGVVVVGVAYTWPVIAIQKWTHLRRRKLRDQLVVASISIGNGAHSAKGLRDCMAEVSQATPFPLRRELQRIVTQVDLGIDLSVAIDNVAKRLNLEPFTLFAVALKTLHEKGGDKTQALQRISRSLKEHQRLEQKMETETAAERRAFIIMALFFPVGFLALMHQLSPDGVIAILTTPQGHLVLAIVTAMIFAAHRWFEKIIHMET
ncbi:MAG: type II secretion system F family protein [Pirellulaceae bacterium]